jgi:hypothetical protein
VQFVTFAVVQFNVVEAPGATPGGDAVSWTEGDDEAPTFTVARATAPPPGPSQFNVKVVVDVMAALWALPLTARLPVQPPVAVHDAALLDVHVNIVVPPLATLLGLAVRLTVGGL